MNKAIIKHWTSLPKQMKVAMISQAVSKAVINREKR